MADGDGAIRAAVTEVFPDTLKAMCWFHCKQACKRNMGKYPFSHYLWRLIRTYFQGKLKSQYPDIFKEVLEDLEMFRNFVVDQEMYCVVWGLLERKYQQEYTYPSSSAKDLTLDFLIRYFKKTYVSSNSLNGFWQGYIPRLAYDSAPKQYFLAPNYQHQKRTI